jgi:hypothetical protein
MVQAMTGLSGVRNSSGYCQLNQDRMNMILLIVITVGAFLYGFAWHDQPAREHESAKPADHK